MSPWQDLSLQLRYGSACMTLGAMGGAFQKKLMGQNGSLTECSAMPKYKNENLNAEMSTNVTVLHG